MGIIYGVDIYIYIYIYSFFWDKCGIYIITLNPKTLNPIPQTLHISALEAAP